VKCRAMPFVVILFVMVGGCVTAGSLSQFDRSELTDSEDADSEDADSEDADSEDADSADADSAEAASGTGGLMVRVRSPPATAVAGDLLVVWVEVCAGESAALVADSDSLGHSVSFRLGEARSSMTPPWGPCRGRHLILPNQCLVSPVEIQVEGAGELTGPVHADVAVRYWWRLLNEEGRCLDERIMGEATWVLTVHPSGT